MCCPLSALGLGTPEKMRKQLLLAILYGFSFTNYAQTQFVQDLAEKLDEYTRRGWEEKVHIHLDKHLYTIGETIWFKVYLVEGFSLEPRAISTLVHVELINPQNEIVASRQVKIDQGGGAGEFLLVDEIDNRMEPGRYFVRAYTNFQRNFNPSFFIRPLEVLASPSDLPKSGSAEVHKEEDALEVLFFPEGGHLVTGLPGRVAFKAIDHTGYGAGISGSIYDQENNFITTIESEKFGMGVFALTPQENRSYYAQIRVDGRAIRRKYPLPAALDQGYTLSVDGGSAKDITIRAQTNLPGGMEGAIIVGQFRGGVFFHAVGEGDSPSMIIRLPKKGLLYNGIAQVTLFGPGQIPHCERLIFLNSPGRDPKVKVATREVYARRDSVDLTIDVGREVVANLSVTVTNFQLVKPSPFAANIKTNLLLTSDLKGHVENPGYYFVDDQPKRRVHLDYLMMTHGWRRFTWEELLQEEAPPILHFPERGFNFGGQLTSLFDAGTPVSGTVSLVQLPSFSEVSEVTTDETGKFIFAGHDLPDTTHMIIQAKASRIKKNGKRSKPHRNVVITMDEHVPAGIDASDLFAPLRTQSQNPVYRQYTMQSEKFRYYTDTAFALNRNMIMLEGITVKAAAPNPFAKFGAIYEDPGPNRRLVMDSLGVLALTSSNIFQLLQGRMAGVQVTGREVSIRGGGTPLYLMNNMPVDSNTIGMIPPQFIHHIDVLKGPETAIYGSRGANGVIAIFTKIGEELNGPMDEVKSTVSITHPGYYRAREFYSPKYNVLQPAQSQRDHRITLAWEPVVITDSLGKATVRFYTADDVAEYRVELEGITADGRLLQTGHFFKTR